MDTYVQQKYVRDVRGVCVCACTHAITINEKGDHELEAE